MGKGWRGSLEDIQFLKELREGKTYVLEDLLDFPSLSPLGEALKVEGVRAYASVPLVAQGELIGAIDLGMAEPGRLSPEQEEVAREVADQVAIGLRQAQLYSQVQRHAVALEQQVAQRTAHLRASEARIRAIVEGAGIGIAVVDREGRLRAGNPALQEMLGHRDEELRDRAFTDFLHPSDIRPWMASIQDPAAEGGSDHKRKLEVRYRGREGEWRWAQATISLVREGTDTPHFAIAMLDDVTEARQAQEALIHSEKMALTGQIAASLAHEINNPLQSVIGCLGLAEETLEGESRLRYYIEIASQELDRVARIVARLRDLNRQSKPEDKKRSDVNDLLERVLELAHKQCQTRHVELELALTDDLPSLKVVPDRIQQVFLNLVLNAVDAMPEGGTLHISTARTVEPAGVSISFADNGLGMAPEVQDHLFEAFFTTKTQGIGLGLHVVKRILAAHDGRIEVESEVGEGSTFRVWLPA